MEGRTGGVVLLARQLFGALVSQYTSIKGRRRFFAPSLAVGQPRDPHRIAQSNSAAMLCSQSLLSGRSVFARHGGVAQRTPTGARIIIPFVDRQPDGPIGVGGRNGDSSAKTNEQANKPDSAPAHSTGSIQNYDKGRRPAPNAAHAAPLTHLRARRFIELHEKLEKSRRLTAAINFPPPLPTDRPIDRMLLRSSTRWRRLTTPYYPSYHQNSRTRATRKFSCPSTVLIDH